MPAVGAFVQVAAQVEMELVSQMEAQLIKNRESLLPLREAGAPKLGLLLNCFGADAKTIEKLAGLGSLDLSFLSAAELESLLVDLPRGQQIIALYTQERLIHGKLPFSEHDCALCECETAHEMAAFLQECGMGHITPQLIAKTGATGRGTLLFLTTEELELTNKPAELSAFNRARGDHRRG